MEGESAADQAPAGRQWSRRLRTAMGLTALGFAGYLLFQLLAPQTIGEQARRLFERQLTEHYRDWDVSVSRGTYRAGVGLIFESIRFRPRSTRSGLLSSTLVQPLGNWWGGSDVVRIQRLTVFADLEPSKLLAEESPLRTRRIAVEGVSAHVRVHADGTHNLATLWPLPQFGPACPQIDVVDATVTVTCPSDCASDRPAESAVTTPPIQLHWSKISVRSTSQTGRDVSKTAGGPAATAAPVLQSRRVEATGSSSFSGPIHLTFQERERDGSVSSPGQPKPPGDAELELRCQRLRVNETLLHRLAPLLGGRACQLDAIAGVRWNVLSDITLAWNRPSESAVVGGRTGFHVDWKIQDGGWSDPRLPYFFDGTSMLIMV